MKTQPIIIMDRRQRPRYGPIAEIENLTYSVLRRYGINGPTDFAASWMPAQRLPVAGQSSQSKRLPQRRLTLEELIPAALRFARTSVRARTRITHESRSAARCAPCTNE